MRGLRAGEHLLALPSQTSSAAVPCSYQRTPSSPRLLRVRIPFCCLLLPRLLNHHRGLSPERLRLPLLFAPLGFRFVSVWAPLPRQCGAKTLGPCIEKSVQRDMRAKRTLLFGNWPPSSSEGFTCPASAQAELSFGACASLPSLLRNLAPPFLSVCTHTCEHRGRSCTPRVTTWFPPSFLRTDS
jgi:hypothetical protein